MERTGGSLAIWTESTLNNIVLIRLKTLFYTRYRSRFKADIHETAKIGRSTDYDDIQKEGLTMIKTFCDICGNELDKFHGGQVNLDFNCYGVTGFRLVLQKREYKNNELQLCVDCANAVVLEIEDLQQIAEMDREKKERENRETSRETVQEKPSTPEKKTRVDR